MIQIAARAARPTRTGTRIFGRRWQDFDPYMLITTIVLMSFGSVSIWSAAGGGPVSLANPGVKQGIFGLVGLAIMFVLAGIDYRLFASISWLMYGAGLALLGLVLVPEIGTEIQGARRWFDFGFTTVQPAEFAKLTTIIALAAFISSRGAGMKELGNFLLSLVIVAVPMLLVAAEPDLDTALMFGVIWVSMMLVTQTRKLYLFGLAALSPAVALLTYSVVLQEFHRVRILVYLGLIEDPLGLAYQSRQAELSIGSAGWTGFGIQGGTQSTFNLLSVRTSDFVFAHASAMFGFVGMIALFAAIVLLLWRCLHVVELARDGFGQCLATGITGLLFCQAVVNIGMNVGLLPVAGIPLPFVSLGLSSLWTFLFAEGLLQSILIYHRKLAFKPD